MNMPKCQCTEKIKIPKITPEDTEEEITKLEFTVRSAIKAMKSEIQSLVTNTAPSRYTLFSDKYLQGILK